MTTIPWNTPEWREQAEAWIAVELAKLGLQSSGPIEQPHTFPWSTVLHVPTNHGMYFFKAVAAETNYEVALNEVLAGAAPSATLPVAAADTERGWMLLPDGGSTLRPIIRADHNIGHWEQILPVYAKLQQATVEHVPMLLWLGVPDRRLENLPELYRGLLADTEVLMLGQPEGTSNEIYAELQANTPLVEQLCAELASYDLPATINHGDLHDGNIFAEGPRFFDWGDASVTHPFFSLRTAYVSAEISLELEENDPTLMRLRDAYLEPWASYAPQETLQQAFAVSQRLAMLTSALSWYQTLSARSPEERGDFARYVSLLLQEFLEVNRNA